MSQISLTPAELQKLISDAVSAAITAHAANAPAPVAAVAAKKNYAAAPSKFNGDQTKFAIWMKSIRLYTEAIIDDDDKIAATMSYMTEGTAASWASAHEEEAQGWTWTEFKEALTKNFQDPDFEIELRNKILKLRVTDWDIRGYFTQLEELASQGGINLLTETTTTVATPPVTTIVRECDAFILDHIRKALPHTLIAAVTGYLGARKDQTLTTISLLTVTRATVKAQFLAQRVTYEDIRDAAISLAPSHKPTQSTSQGNSRFQRKGTSSSTPAKESGSDSSPKPSGSDVRTCYNCGKPGHIGRNCPEPDKRKVKKELDRKAAIRVLAMSTPEEMRKLFMEVTEAKAPAESKETSKDFPKDQ
jgi:hypothetical protein